MFTPALQGGVAYIFNAVHTDGRGTTRFHQVNVGTNYSLSKRTALYAVAIAQICATYVLRDEERNASSSPFPRAPPRPLFHSLNSSPPPPPHPPPPPPRQLRA